MRAVTIIYFLLFTSYSFSQKKFEKYSAIADTYFDKEDFSKAIEFYSLASKICPDNINNIYNISKSYSSIGNKNEAFIWYEKLLKINPKYKKDPEYVNLLLYKGYYKEAKRILPTLTSFPDSAKDRIKAMCDSAIFWNKLIPKFTVENQKKINSKFSDFAPAYFKEGIVFCSTRENLIIQKKCKRNGEPLVNLYSSELNLKGELKKVNDFSSNINTWDNEGPCTFSKNFDTIYFSRSEITRHQNVANLKLFSSVYKNKWSKPLDFMLNDSIYSFGHPSISEDGNLFFFASDIPGGFGGTDIYLSIKVDSNWSLPINLGPEVNTPGNEIFPYYDSGGTLYFSSNYHIGLGGYDIFNVKLENGNWTKAKNLLPPINSSADDFSLIINKNKTAGYFTSNRMGGLGSDDIYYFRVK